MKATPVYYFENCTEATQAANLYYIRKPTATSMTRNTATKTIEVFTRFKVVARFVWA